MQKTREVPGAASARRPRWHLASSPDSGIQSGRVTFRASGGTRQPGWGEMRTPTGSRCGPGMVEGQQPGQHFRVWQVRRPAVGNRDRLVQGPMQVVQPRALRRAALVLRSRRVPGPTDGHRPGGHVVEPGRASNGRAPMMTPPSASPPSGSSSCRSSSDTVDVPASATSANGRVISWTTAAGSGVRSFLDIPAHGRTNTATQAAEVRVRVRCRRL